MPIQESNIVFVESQVMDDVPEGGGAATGRVIIDGQMNNVFEDISDLDRAYGRFNLRKLFLAVRSLSTDLYGGVKTVITALPADPALGYTLFTTDDPFDLRTDAADKVEAYLYKGPMWHGALYENHIEGMRAISVIQNPDTALPPIGKTLCLVQDEGEAGEKEQYVRVIDVAAVATTFTDQQGDFVRWIVRMDLSDALQYDFLGHQPNRFNSYSYTNNVRLRDTTVADATLYYGSHELTQAAAIGDLSVRAASLFTQLVPSAQTETPLTSQILTGELAPMMASRATTVTYSTPGASIAPNGSYVCPSGVYPGSLSLTLNGYAFTDDGAGVVMRSGADNGSIDYASGSIAFNASAPTTSGTASLTYQPATTAAQQAHTQAFPVTVENRRLNWLSVIDPLPTPGTLSLAFMAQGNWYLLSDNGAGQISGSDPTYGAGTISFVTGDLAVTLGALPDADSQIMLTWASPVHYNVRVGNTDIDTSITVEHTVPDPIKPGTLVLTWLQGAVEKTATGAVSGVLSGDATGYVSHITGQFWLKFTTPPDANSLLGIDYQKQTQVMDVITGVTHVNGMATIQIGAAIEPGSLEVEWETTSVSKYDSKTFKTNMHWVSAGVYERTTLLLGANASGAVRTYTNHAFDNGAGDIVDDSGNVNYSTGECTMQLLPDVTENVWAYDTGVGYYWTATQGAGSVTHQFSTGTVTVRYTPAGASPTVVADEIAMPDLRFKILPRLYDEFVTPGSVIFRWNGETYVDRNGVLYRDISPVTGSGTPAGTISYFDGMVTLTDYVSGTGAVTVDALLARFGDWVCTDANFRTALAPIKPEALSIIAVTEDGVQITGTADEDGLITGTAMAGSCNYNFGTAEIQFGAGNPWVERRVDPSSIRYSAVAYKYLPLDAEILGINAVRLPSDGRVPIYRPGGIVLVMNTDDAAPVTISNGQSISAGRTRLAWVRLLDNTGATVSGELYTLDRENGTITVPDVGGLDQPLTLRHTVADLRMITDAQISGQLTLSRVLTHNYPADGTSLVASCLIQGDRRARVSLTWDQSSWDGTWKDYLVGSEATATLNFIDYPIIVTNEGCDTDRWVLRFTGTTTAELISEKRGVVWSGTYSAGGADIAPVNSRTRGPDGSTHYCNYDTEASGPFVEGETLNFSKSGVTSTGVLKTITDNGPSGIIYFELLSGATPTTGTTVTGATSGATALTSGTTYRNGMPYMTIPGAANGGGWSAGNVVRINTIGAIADFWMARSIQQSDEPPGEGTDGCEVYALGNIDRP